MEKVNLKTYIFRISLIFILLISIFSCVYAVQNYKSNNATSQNNMFRIDGNMAPPNGGGQFSSNVNNQSGQDGSTVSNENGNTQSDLNKNKQRGNNRNMQQGEPNGNMMQRGGIDTKYLPSLTIYSVLFLILSCGLYYLVRGKNMEIISRDERLLIYTLLAVGFFLRISASTLINGHNDINLFRNWAETAANGFSQFYTNARQADYPPLYIYILGLIGKIASIDTFNSYYVLMLKIPSIIADVVTAHFIYKLAKKYFSSVISIFLAAFYIFNPAIFIDSTFWGQVDSFFTLLIVIAVYLLCEKKYVLSSTMFTAAVLMKPQGIIFLPILFFELVRQRRIRNFIYAAVSAMITALIIIIPFSLNGQSPLWIFNLYSKTISEYPYASVNAFNFFSLIGANFKNDSTTLFILNYHTIGMIFIIVTTLIGWFVYIKGNDRKYVSAIALLQIVGVFTFSVGMHERYLFPAVALSILAFIYLKDRRFFIMAIGFSITSYINISTVFFKTNTSVFDIFLMGTSLLNVILVIYLIKIILDNTVKKISLDFVNEEGELP
jgi:Gpi18-like mannosyltransferase